MRVILHRFTWIRISGGDDRYEFGTSLVFSKGKASDGTAAACGCFVTTDSCSQAHDLALSAPRVSFLAF